MNMRFINNCRFGMYITERGGKNQHYETDIEIYKYRIQKYTNILHFTGN